MGYFDNFFPHATVVENPIFRFDAKHLPDELTLRLQSIRWIAGIFVAGLLIWSLFAVAILTNLDGALATYEWISTILVWGLLLSFFDKPVLDFIGVSAGLTSIGREINTGRMDLIRLTSVHPGRLRELVMSKHAIAQITSWRVMTFVMAFRLTVVVIAFLHQVALNEIIHLIDPFWLSSTLVVRDTAYYLSIVATIPGATILTVAYVLEPRWRLRALTASSMAVSAQNRDISLSLLTVVLVIVRITASQVMIAIAAMILLFGMGWITSFVFGETATLVALAVTVSAYGYLLGIIIRNTYSGLSQRSLQRATARLERLDKTT